MPKARRWLARASTKRLERSNVLANALCMTTDAANLSQCKHMLLHLTSKTWTRGDESDALGQEVEMAMSMGIHVLLAHEMAGVGGQEVRCGCEFSIFFACAEGATPGRLIGGGLYSELAVPLKGGAWRDTSMVLMGMALGTSKVEVEVANQMGILSYDPQAGLGSLRRLLRQALAAQRLRGWRQAFHRASADATPTSAVSIEISSVSSRDTIVSQPPSPYHSHPHSDATPTSAVSVEISSVSSRIGVHVSADDLGGNQETMPKPSLSQMIGTPTGNSLSWMAEPSEVLESSEGGCHVNPTEYRGYRI